MFRNRKCKNKRLERKHVLKVKMRTSQRRQLLVRRVAWTSSLTLLCMASLYAAWRGGEAAIHWAILDNPYFEIRDLAIENDGVIRRDQLARWAGVRQGLNLFDLDLVRVRRDLEVLPMIASAEIERVLPRTIRIRVKEREPIARYLPAELGATQFGSHGIYTLDTEGYFMAPLLPHQCQVPQASATDHLPFLTGIPRQEVRPGYKAESPQVLTALALIEAFARSPMAGLADLKEIDLSTPGILRVKTAQNATVTFGLSSLGRQLHRWRAVYDYGQRLGKRLASLDLSVANNVPVVWQAGDLSPAPTPSPNRSPHANPNAYNTRKKNV